MSATMATEACWRMSENLTKLLQKSRSEADKKTLLAVIADLNMVSGFCWKQGEVEGKTTQPRGPWAQGEWQDRRLA